MLSIFIRGGIYFDLQVSIRAAIYIRAPQPGNFRRLRLHSEMEGARALVSASEMVSTRETIVALVQPPPMSFEVRTGNSPFPW